MDELVFGRCSTHWAHVSIVTMIFAVIIILILLENIQLIWHPSEHLHLTGGHTQYTYIYIMFDTQLPER